MLLHTLTCPVNLCCDIQCLSLPVYAPTYYPIPCPYTLLDILYLSAKFCCYLNLIPCQFMLLHTLCFPDNICCHIQSHSQSIHAAKYSQYTPIHAATYTHSLSIYVATYILIPYQFIGSYT